MAEREQAKVAKYSKLAADENATFIPFVMESYGAMGAEARAYLRELRKLAVDNSDMALISYLPQRLAVALQKGNARVIQQGYALLAAHASHRN